MRKASEIKELPVMSIQDGANMEKICRLAVNPVTRKVEYLAFAGTAWYEASWVMPWSKVFAVGKDMITIKSRKDISLVNEDLRKTLARTVEIIGFEVIDSSGRLGARVADMAIDETTGELRKFILEDGCMLDISAIVTIGANAVIIEAGAGDQPASSFSENEFLLGKTAAADIADERGNTIITAGTLVTNKEIEAAKAGNVLYDLVTGVQ